MKGPNNEKQKNANYGPYIFLGNRNNKETRMFITNYWKKIMCLKRKETQNITLNLRAKNIGAPS